jgi:hypothetical protein
MAYALTRSPQIRDKAKPVQTIEKFIRAELLP